MATTDLHAHITWDSEPTEEAKNFVRLEVLKALQTTFQEGSWFTELVRTQVRTVLSEMEEAKVKNSVPIARQ